MAKIYVDIPVLEHSSGDVKGMGDSVESAGKSAKSAEGMAGDYEMDGASSYRAWIRGICSNAYSQAKSIDHKLDDLGDVIKKKARDFLLADTASVAGLGVTNSLLTKWIDGSGILSKFAGFVGKYLEKIRNWMKLTNLLGGLLFLSFPTLYFFQKGLTYWRGKLFSGGLRVNWISKQKIATENGDDTTKSTTTPQRITIGGEALLQYDPKGDKEILDLERWRNNENKFEPAGWIPSKEITDVRSHIAAYGCLMTAYTMLLRNKGVDVDVADLYKANYEIETGNSFDIDAEDDVIVLKDLYMRDQPKIINRVASDYTADYKNTPINNLEQSHESLRKSIDANKEIILHVDGLENDGHWIVVDAYDLQKGSYTVRDPLDVNGTNENALIGEVGGYQFFKKKDGSRVLEYKYIRRE